MGVKARSGSGSDRERGSDARCSDTFSPEDTAESIWRTEESWRLVERYCERYPSDWRLVFRRDDEVLEVQVPEEVWRAFDA